MTFEDFADLRIAAEVFRDAQDQRMRLENRLGAGNVDEYAYVAVLEAQKVAEKESKRILTKVYRRIVHPDVRKWQKETRGVGEHLLALLLGHIGHPRWAYPHTWVGNGSARHLVALEPYPRNVGKLWAYCGHGDPKLRRRKGMDVDDAMALGNPHAKRAVHLLAESAVRQRPNEHSVVYYEARERYADHLHDAPCPQCGPKGKPAEKGSPWSNGHQDASALRLTGKAILLHLWEASEGWQLEEI